PPPVRRIEKISGSSPSPIIVLVLVLVLECNENRRENKVPGNQSSSRTRTTTRTITIRIGFCNLGWMFSSHPCSRARMDYSHHPGTLPTHPMPVLWPDGRTRARHDARFTAVHHRLRSVLPANGRYRRMRVWRNSELGRRPRLRHLAPMQ